MVVEGVPSDPSMRDWGVSGDDGMADVPYTRTCRSLSWTYKRIASTELIPCLARHAAYLARSAAVLVLSVTGASPDTACLCNAYNSKRSRFCRQILFFRRRGSRSRASENLCETSDKRKRLFASSNASNPLRRHTHLHTIMMCAILHQNNQITSKRTEGVLAGFHPFMKLALVRKVDVKSPAVAVLLPSTMMILLL